MASNIYYTLDSQEIKGCLGDAGVLHDDNGASGVYSFFHNDIYHLILCLTEGDTRGLIMFRIADLEKNLDEIPVLLTILEAMRDAAADHTELFEEAAEDVRIQYVRALPGRSR